MLVPLQIDKPFLIYLSAEATSIGCGILGCCNVSIVYKGLFVASPIYVCLVRPPLGGSVII
jgi:hypothetical protein